MYGEKSQPLNTVHLQCTLYNLQVQHNTLIYFSSQNNRVKLGLQPNTLELYVSNKLQTLDIIGLSKQSATLKIHLPKQNRRAIVTIRYALAVQIAPPPPRDF
jgi:hypothetical protein